MKSSSLWRISVTAPTESEEAVGVLLERMFGQPASVYSPEGKGTSVTTIYSAKPAEGVRTQEAEIRSQVRGLVEFGLRVGRPKVLIEKVPREDWATSWKKYFKTIQVGSALLIRPSWSKRLSRPGQAVVTLDPGLSFGTGQHPTTGFCLEQVVLSRRKGQSQSFLDIGTGSGILAIAAVKLGYAPVRAFDNDPVAVRVAKANAQKNRVAARLWISRQDLTRVPLTPSKPFDLICANLVQDLLLVEQTRIVNRLAPGGKLVIAGVLTRQFPAVARGYRSAGLRLQAARTEGEWRSGAFVRPT